MPGQGNPWSMAGEFTGDMLMQLLDAPVETGSDFELTW